MVKAAKGLLVEYGLSIPPLALAFDFNPETLTRTRRVRITARGGDAARGGYDFALPTETARASQGVSMEAESFSLTILLDATDRMDAGELIATTMGVQPEIDTLRSMVEPKVKTPGGAQLLASLGHGEGAAFASRQYASVLLFVWGPRILPVFLSEARIEEQAHLPTLIPYRAEATLTLQVIESSNPFYDVEVLRQTVGAGLNTARFGADLLGGLF